MTLAPGSTLGPYQALSPIGAGGMGDVYRAVDARLGRSVALKLLSDAFVADPERLARFEREARILASLGHVNVATLYGFETVAREDGSTTHVIAMELVEGENLAERLRRGPLPVDEAIAVATQVAAALEEAHEKGIVHRDLKPANVKLTPDGKVKVLDFGLARAFESEAPAGDAGVSQSPTMSHAMTEAGMILGTAGYMSPEQARGRPVDKRADVWSLGVVLFEMLSGRQLFAGETVTDVLAAVLRQEIPWETLPPGVPERVRRVLARCLVRDPRERLRDVGDARIELGAPGDETGTPISILHAPPRGRTARERVAWGAAVLLLALLVASLLLRGHRGPVTTLSQVARITHSSGTSEWPTWSADGSLLAYSSNQSGDFEIFVRRVDGGQDVNVTNDPAQDFQPAFSPDGRSIAFVSTRSARTGLIRVIAAFGFQSRTTGGDLWVMPALGGTSRRLAPDANSPVWRPDGRRILYVSGPELHRSILAVPAEGGASETLLSERDSRWEVVRLQLSPDGRWLTFGTDGSELFIMPAAGGKPRLLLENVANHVWDPSGRRVLCLDQEPMGGTRIEAVDVDPERGTLGGRRADVALMTGILRDAALTRDGRQLAVSELEGSMNLTKLPLRPDGSGPSGPEEPLSVGHVLDRYPAVSPDGRRVAFASDRLGPEQLWILDLATGKQERLAIPGEDLGINGALWTPDGRRLAFTRETASGRSLWIASVDGSSAEKLHDFPKKAWVGVGAFSADGRLLLFPALADQGLQLHTMDLATRVVKVLTHDATQKFDPRWSPDGRSIAWVDIADGKFRLVRRALEGGPETVLLSTYERLRHTSYSPDGRYLYVQPSHGNVVRVPVAGGPPEQVTRFPEAGLFIEEPTLSPDGKFLVYCKANGGASLWRLVLSPDAPSHEAPRTSRGPQEGPS